MDETNFDIVDVVNTTLPFEKYLPGIRYCGPGTRLDLRLNENDKPFPGSEPIDRVDEAAMKHVIRYRKYDNLRQRMGADKDMLRELCNIEHSTCRERMERCFVVPIL